VSIGRHALTLFLLALLFGGLACILGYRIMWCVSRAGVPVKVFATVFDTVRIFRVYRQLAPSRGWPLWPITGFWVLSGVAMFCMGLIELTDDGYTSIVTSVRISRPFFLAWVSLSTLCVSFWFTYRVIRKIPRLDTGRRNWKHLLSDEYLRSDAYLAILGWGGLLALWLLHGWVAHIWP